MLNMSLEGGAGQYPSVKGWYRYYSRYPWTPVIDGDIVRPEVTNFLQFNNYDEQQLRSMFFEFQVLLPMPNKFFVSDEGSFLLYGLKLPNCSLSLLLRKIFILFCC